jgi:hypothetical protein
MTRDVLIDREVGEVIIVRCCVVGVVVSVSRTEDEALLIDIRLEISSHKSIASKVKFFSMPEEWAPYVSEFGWITVTHKGRDSGLYLCTTNSSSPLRASAITWR